MRRTHHRAQQRMHSAYEGKHGPSAASCRKDGGRSRKEGTGGLRAWGEEEGREEHAGAFSRATHDHDVRQAVRGICREAEAGEAREGVHAWVRDRGGRGAGQGDAGRGHGVVDHAEEGGAAAAAAVDEHLRVLEAAVP